MKRILQRKFSCIAVVTALILTAHFTFPEPASADSPYRWTASLNNPGANGTDEGHGIAFTADGCVVVAGRTYSEEEGFNIWLGKFSPRGTLLWSRVYNSPHNSTDEGWDVAVGPDGQIVVTGRTRVPGQGYDLWLGKFTPEGSLLWETTYSGPAGGKDEGRGVDVGSDGSIYVTGGVTFNGFLTDLWVGRFDGDGLLLWENAFDGGASGKDTGYGMVLGDAGTVYTSGSVTSPDGELDIRVASFTDSGSPAWDRRAPREAEGFRDGRSVTVGADGSILVAGSVPSADGVSLIWLGSFSPSGELLWESTAGTGSTDARARDLAAAHNGKIYVVGTVDDLLEDRNIWIGRFNRHGRLEKEIVFDGGEGLSDEAMAVAVGRPNDIAVTGYTSTPGEGENIWVWKSRGTTVKEMPEATGGADPFSPLSPSLQAE